MTHASTLIAFALSLIAVVATIGIGAFLLCNTVKDVLKLGSSLPTRALNEDTSETRQSNRQKALLETLWLLTVRSMPGGAVVTCGLGLLIWICYKLIPMFLL